MASELELRREAPEAEAAVVVAEAEAAELVVRYQSR